MNTAEQEQPQPQRWEQEEQSRFNTASMADSPLATTPIDPNLADLDGCLASSEPSEGPNSTGELTSSGAETGAAIAPHESMARVRRRPIPRKGHTKSRNGCYNCKRRKVKCHEDLPTCYHCRRIGLVCEYPPLKNQEDGLLRQGSAGASTGASPGPSAALQSTPTMFTIDDMRFFQHFLLAAYPSLPIGGHEVWKEVAQMSHSYDFLIHSMLGLGAQHLTLCTNMDYTKQALSHRVQAIKALNAQLSKPNPTQEEGDAAFGAVMSLCFQSSYMADGMMDFVSMVRGCHVVALKAMPSFQESLFNSFSREGHVESVQKFIDQAGMKRHNYGIADEFLASTRSLAPLCKSVFELKYLADIQRVMNLAKAGDPDTYMEFAKLYNIFGEMSNDDWINFIDAKNYATQLLLVHFLLMDYVINGSIMHDTSEAYHFRKEMTLIWMGRIAEKLPPRYKHYIAWPMQFGSGLPLEHEWPRHIMDQRPFPSTEGMEAVENWSALRCRA